MDSSLDDVTMTMELADGMTTGPFTGARLKEALGQLKNTAEDRAVVEKTYRATAAELRGFVERYEELEIEKQGLVDGQKEILKEAKGRGYSVSALRQIIRERKKDQADVDEALAILELYRTALRTG